MSRRDSGVSFLIFAFVGPPIGGMLLALGMDIHGLLTEPWPSQYRFNPGLYAVVALWSYLFGVVPAGLTGGLWLYLPQRIWAAFVSAVFGALASAGLLLALFPKRDWQDYLWVGAVGAASSVACMALATIWSASREP